MEAVDEVHVVAPPSYDKLQDAVSPIVAKGKRTKRQRLPLPLTITTTNDNNQNNRLSPSSSAAAANSSEEESTTTEEEDTARCLILLARGRNFQTHPLNNAAADDDDDDDDHRYDYYSKQSNSRKRPRKAGGGACMYACKTCDRVFPSFQALGGHRASHKKPRNEKIKTAIFLSDEEEYIHELSQKTLPPTSLSLQLSNISSAAAAAKTFPSPRTHECSYCGAEFASGQALGGHMRRHRPVMSLTSSNRVAAAVASVEEPESEEWRKRRNGLSLDLNLPAPEKLVISTAAGVTLVDCHF